MVTSRRTRGGGMPVRGTPSRIICYLVGDGELVERVGGEPRTDQQDASGVIRIRIERHPARDLECTCGLGKPLAAKIHVTWMPDVQLYVEYLVFGHCGAALEDALAQPVFWTVRAQDFNGVEQRLI